MSREEERQPMTPIANLVAATDMYHFLQPSELYTDEFVSQVLPDN